MIEFKADCGHTVRARDEDAGKQVSCSYCGRAATVPDQLDAADGLDALFGDLPDDTGAGAAVSGSSKRSKRRRKSGSARARRKNGEFDPFTLVWRLCYVTASIIALILLVHFVVLPVIEAARESWAPQRPRTANQPTERRTPATDQPLPRGSDDVERREFGLKTLPGTQGLYVSCVPAAAECYWMHATGKEELFKDKPVRLRDLPDSKKVDKGLGRVEEVRPGSSVTTLALEFAVPWNHPCFADYPGMMDFRHRIEEADRARREALLAAYFLPDESSEVFVEESSDLLYFVRRYENVEVRRGEWTAVRAVFLPRIDTEERGKFSVEGILPFLPTKHEYGFDEQHVQNELEGFYLVPAADQIHLLEMLRRVGIAPYTADGRRCRLFKIDVSDGKLRVADLTKR